MKISFNPSNSNKNILDLIKNNKDIIFDLKGHSIFARGVEFKGTDTNTWRDIKINNVSIGSHTLGLQNGSNTTLTNTNGVVTINSTWRPVVDNLTSDSTTSSLSAKQGKVLKALIDGKSNSAHNHDGRYVKKSGDTMQGVLTIDTTNFGALTIKRNDDASGASIQFRGKSSVYGYIGLNNSTKDKQFLRWSSDTSRVYTILDTSSTYISNGKGVINGTTITQVNNATNSTNSTNADKVDGVHLNGIFTGFSYAQSRLTATIGTVSKTVDVTGSYPSISGITMNTIASFGNCMGMANLASSNSNVNPNNQTSWHHFINMSYNTETANMQQTQFAIKAGTTEVWVRSRAGGYISDSSAWTAPWVRLARTTDDIANAYHLRINAANTWSTWYWIGQSGQPSWVWGSDYGTNMYVWNPSNFNVNTAQYLRSLGNQNCQTGRTQAYGDVYSYNTYSGNTGSPTTYSSVIGFGRGSDGTVEIAGGWCNTNLYWRSLRDHYEDWYPWRVVLDSSNYSEFINNYYWANVKISTSSSTTTSPTFSNVYLGNSLYLNNNGSNSIYNGPNNSANGVGGPLNNLVFSSWWGVSFTTSCAKFTYTNKNAVSIDCRTGQLYAKQVQANGFVYIGHNNNDAVLLAGGGYRTLKDFIFLNKSYNYTDNEHYNLSFHKLSGICNNLVWVDGHVRGFISKAFVIDPAVFPYPYNNDSNLGTTYLMTGNNYITINTKGTVIINNATDHKQRVGFFYTGRA